MSQRITSAIAGVSISLYSAGCVLAAIQYGASAWHWYGSCVMSAAIFGAVLLIDAMVRVLAW
jgi:hypothetical protein